MNSSIASARSRAFASRSLRSIAIARMQMSSTSGGTSIVAVREGSGGG
jgi:hypothetical protein